MTDCNLECTTEHQSKPNKNVLNLKEQLKALSLEERYNLVNAINIEERSTYIKEQEKIAKEEEDKIAQCPVAKKVVSMNMEIQELKMELQKLKNNTNENTLKCPYSKSFLINQEYLNDLDLCNEITETYTSSFSWWSTILFIVFILFVMTGKPTKHCEFFTTTM
jgi:hypothetical protein